MVIKLFFEWWYVAGWKMAFNNIFRRARLVSENMSLSILLNTLFSPWKQLISHTGQGATIQDKLRAMLDNIVSRLVGFFVRVFVLLAGGILIIIVTLFSVILAVAWPVIPWLPILFIVLGVQLS